MGWSIDDTVSSVMPRLVVADESTVSKVIREALRRYLEVA